MCSRAEGTMTALRTVCSMSTVVNELIPAASVMHLLGTVHQRGAFEERGMFVP